MASSVGPIAILPGPANLSYQGFCNDANCTAGVGPFDEANAGARIVTVIAPPQISSPSEVSVAENETAVIDMVGTDNLDSEGDNLLYAITGGADQALFAIDATTGVLTFITAPDFEAPAVAGAANLYEVPVTLSDLGGLTSVQLLIVTVTDVIEDSCVEDFTKME